MHDTGPDSEPAAEGDDASDRTPLRRRENRPVAFDRRRRSSDTETFDIGSMLELHLDQCKTRRSMMNLLEQWLAEARNREPASQNPEYAAALEGALEVMRQAPDIETGIVMLQRRS